MLPEHFEQIKLFVTILFQFYGQNFNFIFSVNFSGCQVRILTVEPI